MGEWIIEMPSTQFDEQVSVLATRLISAWFCGWIVAKIARWNQPKSTEDTLTLTLILMSVLIAMATQIIGDNIARAFSLVGALSIVRFRTAVSATRDIAFVLAAVVVGMAIGAGQYWVAGIGLVVIALATQISRGQIDQDKTGNKKTGDDPPKTWRLTIQVGLSQTDGWEAELERLTERYQLTSAETTRRGSAMEMIYRIVPKVDISAVEIVSVLNGVPGVESVTTKLS